MSFSIVLNSAIYLENSNNQIVEYAYDFTNMEEGKYEVTFTYRGQQNHLDSTDLCLVYVDFGTSRNVFRAGSQTSNKYIPYLGFLHNQYNTNTDGYLYANLNDNGPIYLNQKPSGTNITVRLVYGNGSVFETHGGQFPADYILTLNFKKI
jgi:hypothetical protein